MRRLTTSVTTIRPIGQSTVSVTIIRNSATVSGASSTRTGIASLLGTKVGTSVIPTITIVTIIIGMIEITGSVTTTTGTATNTIKIISTRSHHPTATTVSITTRILSIKGRRRIAASTTGHRLTRAAATIPTIRITATAVSKLSTDGMRGPLDN
jgi:hypothetical protein